MARVLTKPAVTDVGEEHQSGVVHVKFSASTGLRLAANGELSGDASAAAAVLGELVQRSAILGELFHQHDDWLLEFVEAAEVRSGLALQDLSLFHRITVAPGSVAELCDALNRLDAVELAWPAPGFGDPTAPCAAGSAPPLDDLQGYREPAPLGIDADYANDFSGGRGIGVTIVDVETGWTFNHVEFDGKIGGQSLVSGTPANFPWSHGTATMAEILGSNDGSGVIGIASDAGALLATHTPEGAPFSIATAVMDAVAAATPGDIVMLEVQCSGGAPSPYPCEFDPAIFAACQAATASGIHVIAAAGNGSNDLDGVAYGGAFDLGQQDSGAILVGASDGSSLSRAGFSNFGSRLTSSGWGEDVTTAGYGDLVGGSAQQQYTATFNGTSSATPIVAGAAAVLISMEREAFGTATDPLAMRDLLAQTGTATLGAIGSRPDLAAAIVALDLPRIAHEPDPLTPNVAPIVHAGAPGDAFLLLYSLELAGTPLALPPYGYLNLEVLGTTFVVAGTLDGGGAALSALPFPPPGPLSGVPVYLQAAQLFAGTANGSFTNSIVVVVP